MASPGRLIERFLPPMIVLAAILWVCLPAVDPDRVLFFRDHMQHHRREMFRVAQLWWSGHLPLWDQYTGGGEPLAAYVGGTPFSPFLLLTVFGDARFWYDLVIVAHVPAAAIGAFLLGRALDLGREAAFLFALLFSLSGMLISLNSAVPTFESASLGPLAIAAAIAVVRRPSKKSAALFALALALHVEVTDPALLFADAVFFLGAVFSLDLLGGIRGRTLITAGALVGGAVLAAGLAAVQIVPFLELLSGSARGAGLPYDHVAQFSVLPLRLFELFFPGLSGDQGAGIELLSSDPQGRLYLPSLYFGASVFPLLVLSVRARSGRIFTLVALFFSLLMLGRFFFLHRLLIELLPVMRAGRYPEKFAYGFVLAAAASVATAFDRHLAEPPDRARAVVRYGGPALFLAIAGLALVLGERMFAPYVGQERTLEDAKPFIRAATAHAILAAGLAFLILWAGARGLARPFSGALFLSLVAFDLGLAAKPALPLADAHLLDRPPILDLVERDAAPSSPSVLQYDFFKGPETPYVPTREQEAETAYGRLSPGLGAMYGVRYFLDPALNAQRDSRWVEVHESFEKLSEPERYRMLGRFATTHIVVESNVRDIPGLEYVGSAPVPWSEPISAFRLKQTRGFFSSAESLLPVARFEEEIALLGSESRPLSEATISADDEVRLDPAFKAALAAGGGRQGPLRIEPDKVEAATIELTATSTGAHLLLVAQRYTPGWHAELDGAPASPIRADTQLLALPLLPGRHTVRFWYWPRSTTVGLLATVVSLLLAGALFVGKPRAR